MYLRRSRQLRSMWTAGCERTAFWDRQWSRNGTTSREWELHPQANREYKFLLFQRILMPIGPHTIHLSKTSEFAGNSTSTHSSGIYQQTVTFVAVNVVAHIPMLKCSYSNATFVSQRPNWEQGTLLSNLQRYDVSDDGSPWGWHHVGSTRYKWNEMDHITRYDAPHYDLLISRYIMIYNHKLWYNWNSTFKGTPW